MSNYKDQGEKSDEINLWSICIVYVRGLR